MTYTMTVEVERVTFASPDGSFAITKCILDREQPPHATAPKWIQSDNRLTVVGNFGSVQPGDLYDIEGDDALNPKFGWQIKAQILTVCARREERALVAFLRKLPQIGSVRAQSIIKHFGGVDPVFDVLDHTPDRLTEISGVTPERAHSIAETFKALSGMRDAWNFCRSLNLDPKLTVQIMESLGADAKRIIEEDPFRLGQHMGMSFHNCDIIHKKLGIADDDIRRLSAGVLYLLSAVTQQGHCWSHLDDLVNPTDSRVKKIRAEINFTNEHCETGIQALSVEEQPRLVFLSDRHVSPAGLYYAEKQITDRLNDLLTD